MKKQVLILSAVTNSLLMPAVLADQTATNSVTPPSGSASSPHAYGEQKGDLPNFHEVHPFLYRGGEPNAAGLVKLKAQGISTIIDLRGNPKQTHQESKQTKELGMKYINLPMSSQPPTPHQVKVFVSTVESAANGNGKVFVHCAHGSDRTGCMVGIWRVTHDGFSYDDAYKEMRKYYFSPKFTQLSDTVRQQAEAAKEKADREAALKPK